MSSVVYVDMFDFGTLKEARALGGKYAGQGATEDEAVQELRSRLPLNELPSEPDFRIVRGHCADIVAVVLVNGRIDVRHRGSDDVIFSAQTSGELTDGLKRRFPAGFKVEIRYDT
jgi:hypothetical protein